MKYIKILLLLLCLLPVLCACSQQNPPEETTMIPELTIALIEQESAVSFLSCFAGESQATGVSNIPEAKLLSGTQTATLEKVHTDAAFSNETLIFSFTVKAVSACTPVEITVSGRREVTQSYAVPVQWTRIDIPVKMSRPETITIKCDGQILLGEAMLEPRGSKAISTLYDRCGMYVVEEFVDVILSDDGDTLVGASMDLVKSGDLIYSIGNGMLTITDVSDVHAPKVLSRLGDMGSSIRQICMLGDGKHVFISSRQNGCYIVNVADPANPALVSRYDSVEMATGVDAYGDYVYVCDRQYGVEIVDVQDVQNPVQLSIVRGGTAQSCKVVDGILYMGSWNERSVDIYDVRQPSDPQYLGSAPLSGKGDGMMIKTVNGKTYLYAATGQHGLGVAENTSDTVTEEDILSDLNFGQGNGLDIFDVTDPKNPVWLSTSRIDGRYYFPNNDYWEVELAEGNGRLYAYVLNTYNGVYILDVTDPAAPVRVGHVAVRSGSVGLQHYSGRGYVFPYNQQKVHQSPIAGIAVADGALFMASSMTDLHICTDPALQPYLFQMDEKSQAVAIEPPTGDFYQLDGQTLGLQSFAHYQSVGQTYAVIVYRNRVYAACGKEGVVVLDTDLNKLATIPTRDIAMDVQIYEGRLFCAESAGGLACYQLSADGLSAQEQWRYVSQNGVVRQVRLSPKARWAVIQCGSSYGEIVSTNAPTSPTVTCQAASQMYHHTVLNTLAGGRYTAIWAEGGKTFWYDFGTADDYAAPKLINEWKSNQCAINNGSMTGNVADYPNCVLATVNIANSAQGGYVIYDPTGTNEPLNICRDYDDPFSGKPAVSGNLLVTGERINGRICIVDITNIGTPRVQKTVPVSGNPDIPYFYGDTVYVPLGYQGLVKFSVAEFR